RAGNGSTIPSTARALSTATVERRIVSGVGKAATWRRARRIADERSKAGSRSPGRALATCRTRSGRADGEETGPGRSVRRLARERLGEGEGARLRGVAAEGAVLSGPAAAEEGAAAGAVVAVDRGARNDGSNATVRDDPH